MKCTNCKNIVKDISSYKKKFIFTCSPACSLRLKYDAEFREVFPIAEHPYCCECKICN